MGLKKQDILDLLQRNPKCSRIFLEKVRNEDSKHLETLASEIARKAVRLAKQVTQEFWRLGALTRLNLSPHGILFATIDPQFQVEDKIVKWFWERFPLFVIVLESKPRRGVFLYGPDFPYVIFTKTPLKDVITDLERQLPMNSILKDVSEFSETLWEKYYASQYIPSRKNLKLFLNRMPRKYLKWKGLEPEARFGNRRLDEFMSTKQ